MSHRGTKARAQTIWAASQWRQGRADARAGLPARYADQHYQRGYREGEKAADAQQRGGGE